MLAVVAPRVPTEVDPLWIAILLDPTMRIFAFIWGALWGSFGNVVIYRLPVMMERQWRRRRENRL